MQPTLPTSAREQKRVTVRYRCAPATLGRVCLADGQDEEYQFAWISNLSTHGVGLVLSRPVATGTVFLLQIRSNNPDKVYDLSAQVVHCTRPFANGEWSIGCEFLRPLLDQDLDQLL